MLKRLLSMLLCLMMAGCLCCTALAEDDTVPAEAGNYYVYTANGKTLNVRDTPGGTVVGSLKFGARIYVYCFVDDNWALIDYKYDKPGYGVNTYACYVNRRFLTKKNPGSKPASAKTISEAVAAASDMLTDINSEFRSAKTVTPYRVTVRPTRVSGWVNMRWAPSTEAEIEATYKANSQLTVIKEMTNWLQVEDPETGNVGFVSRSFVME